MEKKSSFSRSVKLSEELFLFGSSFLVFYASLILLQTTFFFLKLNLQNASTIFAIIITLAYIVLAIKTIHTKTTRKLVWLVLFCLVFISIGFLASFFVDTSWDGRDYHQKAVRQLLEGWNPVYQEIEPKDIYYNAWLNHYPKAAWLSSALIIKLTGDMEVGKVFNLFLILSVFSLSFSYFIVCPTLKTWQAFAISLFLTGNPVSVYQSLSNYQDGQVSSMYILWLLLTLFSLRRSNLFLHLTIISTLVIGLNIKFTGTAYYSVLLAGLLIANGIFIKKIKPMLPLIGSMLVGTLIGIFFVGYNPYITNTVRYGNPFYPVYGSAQFNKDYIMGGQSPANFINQSQMKKLYFSLFSRSENVYGNSTSHLKNPLSLTNQEIKEFGIPDVRIGGWGPLFGAALIASVISLIWVFLVSREMGILGLGLSGFVLFTCLLNGECWWARYSPQLYLIPIVILTFIWIAGDRKLNFMGFLLAGIIFLNLLLVSGVNVYANFKKTMSYRNEIANIIKNRDEIMVYHGPLDSITVDLDKFNISYHSVSDKEALPCPRELLPSVYYSYLDCSDE